MSFFINGKETEVDYISDVDRITERLPRYQEHFEAIQERSKVLAECALAKMNSQAVGMSRGGTMQQIAAGIPISVWATMHQIDPELFLNKRKFYAWLAKHPEYRVGKTVIRSDS